MNILNKSYKALSEGKISKSEFLRQVRQNFPNLITPFNSYEDTVRILKGKGLLTEEVVYQCAGDKFSSEAILRGIRYELEKEGFCDFETPGPGDYKKARQTAIDNLCKDPLYYINKLALAEKPKKNKQKAREVVKNLQESDQKIKAVKKKLEKPVVKQTVMSNKGKDSIQNNKLLREAITRTVCKILSEAATTNLAQFSDQNASIQNVPAILNSLENIVTEIESFIIKEKSKIQSIFDSVGDIKNEDNIPIGYKFVQPILDAFKKDLEPVLQKVTLDDIKLVEAPEELQSSLGEPEEKETVFSPEPLSESKSKKKYTK